MIKVILGPKGSGKTKAFIESVKKGASEAKGNVVCITGDDGMRVNLNYSIRLSNAKEFAINNYEVFYGFLCGIISEDFDITHIYIDRVNRIVNGGLAEFSEFIKVVEKISKKFNISFTISISADADEVSDDIKKYLVKF